MVAGADASDHAVDGGGGRNAFAESGRRAGLRRPPVEPGAMGKDPLPERSGFDYRR